MEALITIKEFYSTFKLLYYLVEHNLLESFEVEIQGGMWYNVTIKGAVRDQLSNEDYKKLIGLLYQYFHVWIETDSYHQELNIPPHKGRYSAGRVEEGNIFFQLDLGYYWTKSEFPDTWDEDYLIGIGCTIEDGIATDESWWGEVEIKPTDSPFNDKEQYSLTL